VRETARMQGTNDPTRVELLDAAALCRHLVDAGSVYAFLADHRKDLFPDELFADLFPSGRGRRQSRLIRWPRSWCCRRWRDCRIGRRPRSCARTSPGRSPAGWPDRPGLSSHGADLVAQQASSLRPARADLRGGPGGDRSGWVLAGRQRRALDSTLLDDAVATQDTVTQLVGAVRRVRRLHPAAAILSLRP
jgi:hypothetical protein